MQQRVSLCRALIHDPILLMLDEPFAALDAFTREELWLTLQDVFVARRPTVILVTHDLREAVFLADRVLVMSARPGRIIAERAVDLPRPRQLDMTYEPYTVALVHALREHISAARSTVACAWTEWRRPGLLTFPRHGRASVCSFAASCCGALSPGSSS
jgi:NitT/TauT family transport system ATP-binding protein